MRNNNKEGGKKTHEGSTCDTFSRVYLYGSETPVNENSSKRVIGGPTLFPISHKPFLSLSLSLAVQYSLRPRKPIHIYWINQRAKTISSVSFKLNSPITSDYSLQFFWETILLHGNISDLFEFVFQYIL